MKRVSVALLSVVLLSGVVHAFTEQVSEKRTLNNGTAVTLKIKNSGWFLLNYEFDRYACTHNEIGQVPIISGSLFSGKSTSYPVYSTSPVGRQCRVKLCPTPCYESNTKYLTVTESSTIRCSGTIFSFYCEITDRLKPPAKPVAE